MRFESMACEIERDRPLTAFERVAGAVAILSPLLGLAATGAIIGLISK